MKDLKKEINKKVDKFLLTQEFGKYDSEIADALVPASVYTDADDLRDFALELVLEERKRTLEEVILIINEELDGELARKVGDVSEVFKRTSYRLFKLLKEGNEKE